MIFRLGNRLRLVAFTAALAALLAAAPALGAFPGSDPDESVRQNTPNDPDFDPCEPDNPGGATCSNVFGQETERFGFAPAGTQNTARYNSCPAGPAVCNDPHTKRLEQQNEAAGRTASGQVSGVSADRAWKRSIGRPDVQVAILDTGIRWNNRSLRKKVALNAEELPRPREGTNDCPADDCNGDGAFDVDDYASDPRVAKTDGNPEADAFLDASDLIAAFSNGADEDRNGFTDDIAGWDFFDDDNDPYDASSYSSAANHGSGRAGEAGAQTDDDDGGTGVCPRCQIMPLRIWDTFVADVNNLSQAALYAADNDAEVVEAAIGGLNNSSFARAAFREAYRKGVFFTIVSSDLNTADHNIPTLYDEALQVQGTVADVQGLGMSAPDPLGSFLGDRGISTSAPVSTWFRNSGTTQYGGHAHITMPAVTGSAATGQAAGAAGLIASYGRQRGKPLAPNEIKQLLTLTAEDVVPANTAGVGVPDPSQPGWDQHFGYGRPDLGLALERIARDKIPPQAMITGPEWFAPLNVTRQQSVRISGRLSADRAAGYTYRLQWAPGIEPAEGEFRDVGPAASKTAGFEGTLGTIDLKAVRAALDARPGGGATLDPTAPAKGPGDKDPNEPAFTVRVVATDSAGNRGEDRKVLFDYRDTSLRPGFSKPLGGGGEQSQRLFDLDGDNKLDLVQADSSGLLRVLRADGSPLPSFNRGRPVRTLAYANTHAGAPSIGAVGVPRETLTTPAIGDVDGDLEPEIVATAGEHIYAWNADGSVVPGFPVRIDPAFSRPADRTRENHVKRGFIASASLGDLTGDGALEIVAPSLDQHVYALDGRGRALPGFPKKLSSDGLPGAEIINTAAVGDISGDRRPEIVVPTAELDDNPTAPGAPSDAGDLAGAIRSLVTNVLANALGGSGRTYALGADGKVLSGWPAKPNGALPGVLPLVGPGVDQVLGNVDDDAQLEVIGNVATGDVQARNGDGSDVTTYDPSPPTGEAVDKTKVLNLFENPIVADLDGLPGPEVIKGGVTLSQLVNIGVAVGQNLPYNHVVQAWNGQTGASLPAFPQAVEDFQLLSSPAVADVSGAAGREVVAGTGLYYIRDFNAAGVEGEGFPKFTGGWNYGVPAIGDADGDGKLELSAITREGYAFLWDTGRPACGTNDQWWTSRHDERSSGAAGTDSRPPGSPRALRAARSGAGVSLSWKAPGDDWLCGNAARYRVLASSAPIVHPRDGKVVGEFDAAAKADDGESRVVSPPAGTDNFAVVYRDDAGNWGHLSRTALASGGAGASIPPGVHPSAGGRVILGTRGDDRLRGTPGNDVIICGAGNDRVVAGAGDDYIDCDGGNDTINAGAGRDRVLGGSGNDFIRGYSGSDILSGNSGRDRIGGGTGADAIAGDSGSDRITGNSGRDRIRGNRGNDRLGGGSGRDRLSGGSGPDRLSGNSGNDRLSGRSGNDRLFGGTGRDILFGGPGRDRLFGNSGNDRLSGGRGRDRLRGGSGRDRVSRR